MKKKKKGSKRKRYYRKKLRGTKNNWTREEGSRQKQKREKQREKDYKEREEIDSILKQIDRETSQGSRDYALLATMFNTGAVCRRSLI